MARYLPALDYIIPAVIGHHERYDGRGYPRRIGGEDIPLLARILCIADSFDAMTSKRCYKEAVSLERGIQILTEEAGRQFDPKLVPVFVAELKRGGIQLASQRKSAGNNPNCPWLFPRPQAAGEKPLLFYTRGAIFCQKRKTISKRRTTRLG